MGKLYKIKREFKNITNAINNPETKIIPEKNRFTKQPYIHKGIKFLGGLIFYLDQETGSKIERISYTGYSNSYLPLINKLINSYLTRSS